MIHGDELHTLHSNHLLPEYISEGLKEFICYQ
jgi:hypothetical protein